MPGRSWKLGQRGVKQTGLWGEDAERCRTFLLLLERERAMKDWRAEVFTEQMRVVASPVNPDDPDKIDAGGKVMFAKEYEGEQEEKRKKGEVQGKA